MKLLEVLATNLLAMFLAGVMGLFFEGAIYLPITGGYLGRVIITLGQWLYSTVSSPFTTWDK